MLSALIRGKGGGRGTFATATVATVATLAAKKPRTVASVASVAVANSADDKQGGPKTVAIGHEIGQAWPEILAMWPDIRPMSDGELATFMGRVGTFMASGMGLADAEAKADELKVADRRRARRGGGS